MYKLTSIGLVLVFIAIITTPAFAKRHGWQEMANDEEIRAERIEHLKLLLDLTPKQESEIKAIITESRAGATEHREIARKNREELRGLLEANTLDEARLRELVHEQADIRADRMVHKYTTRTAIRQVLTPEQQEKSQALRKIKKHRKGFQRQGPARADVKKM